MPSEPDKRIEPLLKAYAEKRTQAAGEGASLHPAMRRLLQEEVKKIRPSAEATSRSRWYRALGTFWPRLAMAAAILVVMGILAVTLVPTNQQSPFTATPVELAKQLTPIEPGAAQPAGSSPNEGLRPTSASSSTSKAEPRRWRLEQPPRLASADTAVQERRSFAAPESVPQPQSAPIPAPRLASPVKRVDRAGEAGAGATPVAAPALTPTTVRSTPAPAREVQPTRSRTAQSTEVTTATITSEPRARSLANVPPPNSLDAGGSVPITYFRNVAAGAASATDLVAQPGQADRYLAAGRGGVSNYGVMTRFAFEKQGSSVRIVDDDGSIYEGRVVEQSGMGAAALAQQMGRESLDQNRGAARTSTVAVDGVPALLTTNQFEGAGVRFVVIGTNRTLGQRIELTGNLLMNETNLLKTGPVPGLDPEPAGDGPLRSLASGSLIPTNQADRSPAYRLIGRARIGGAKESPIEAIPGPR